MSLRSALGVVRAEILSRRFQRVAPLGGNGPVVSFTFDDFPRSALSVGAEILEQFGARGTYYVAAGLENTTNSLGDQFRQEDLKVLALRGHEVAIHGFDHLSARRTPVGVFIEDVARCEREIRRWIAGHASRSFAYPYGEVTLSTKRLLGPQMASSRGTVGGLNGPMLDLNLLRANRLYGDMHQFAAVQELIERNRQEKAWLIFYTHDVASSPSQFGCTPELLTSTVAFARQRGCKLMTVAGVVDQIGCTERDQGTRAIRMMSSAKLDFRIWGQ